ncbi:MAG: HD domain-containing phosphohydrolase [Campylobacterota bacterium]|nr:HD domain-containing phosphohydrolase [Campylobacterota bacterium]
MRIDPKMSFSDINHLVYAIELRDAYTQGHSERVAKYSYILSATLGLSLEDCNQIYTASLLHDVGKIGIPDAVLLKPGKLEENEYQLIKQYGTLSGKILEKMEHFKYLAPTVKHHHENYNGTGYPDGLKAKEIPLGARIISIADVFDALTTRRIYRGAMSLEKAISIMDNMQEGENLIQNYTIYL